MINVDPISSAMFGIDSPILNAIARFLDLVTYPILFGLWLFIVLTTDKRYSELKRRTGMVLLAAIALIVLVQITKSSFAVVRPCASFNIPKALDCPTDGSFPSGHAAASALLLPFFFGSSLFVPFFVFYAAVSISRVYLGAHFISDVIAGTVIGLSCYFIIFNLFGDKSDFTTHKRLH